MLDVIEHKEQSIQHSIAQTNNMHKQTNKTP